MEIQYEGTNTLFEWDSNKAEQNLEKHEVSFFDAAEAYEDPFFQMADDDLGDYGEDRERIIGVSQSKTLLLVVYVERTPRIRIISAREANRSERKVYEQQFRWS